MLPGMLVRPLGKWQDSFPAGQAAAIERTADCGRPGRFSAAWWLVRMEGGRAIG